MKWTKATHYLFSGGGFSCAVHDAEEEGQGRPQAMETRGIAHRKGIVRVGSACKGGNTMWIKRRSYCSKFSLYHSSAGVNKQSAIKQFYRKALQ